MSGRPALATSKCALQGLAGTERAPGGAEFTEGETDPGKIFGADVGWRNSAAAAGGGECFGEHRGVGRAAPLGGFEAFHERGALEGRGNFRGRRFGGVEFGGEGKVRGAGRDVPEKRVAPTERRFDDEMKRVVWEDALAGQVMARRRAVGPLADERIRRGGRRIFSETNEHGVAVGCNLLSYKSGWTVIFEELEI